MSYNINRLAEHPAFLVSINKDFNIGKEMPPFFSEIKTMLDQELNPLSVILDMTQFTMSFDDFLKGTQISMSSRNENPAVHSMTKEFIIIAESSLWKMSLDGFRKLGAMRDARIVKTLDEALSIL
jgi:hypothetical protein